MTVTALVIGVWTLFGVIAVAAIGSAVWKGIYSKSESAVAWRIAKVVGTSLGSVGLLAALIAFEGTVREFNRDSEKYLLVNFLELKFQTVAASAIACSKDQSLQATARKCFDFENLNRQVDFATLQSGKHFQKPSNWQKEQELEPMIQKIGQSFDQLNTAIDHASEQPILSQEARSKLSLSALFLIIAALACSIGESVFQLQEERRRKVRATL